MFPEVILATCIESVPNVLIPYDPSNSTSRNLSYGNIERCKGRSVQKTFYGQMFNSKKSGNKLSVQGERFIYRNSAQK